MTNHNGHIRGRGVWNTADIGNTAAALAVTATASESAEWRDGYHAALVAMLVALNCGDDVKRIEAARRVTT